MRTYGQYCPLARASEILASRWTPLVIRNLMFGADTFSAIASGVPQMSRSMLVTRLDELERAGVISAVPKPRGRGRRYLLTEAGRDLATVVTALSEWGERWVEIGPAHTDPGFALWAWCRVQLDRAALPTGRVVTTGRRCGSSTEGASHPPPGVRSRRPRVAQVHGAAREDPLLDQL
ncbi:winged helix-turn-helix transcriptional regulator [Pseudonocardia benzenivorans]|uniref:Winged helix-turn-helix transcriptional regulator n=1 Tax=Pseudonocardia benzenivorans TaxID=228005 RepID=A0ABW3VS59_9PSEU